MTTVQKAVCGSNEAERLRTLLRQWVNDDEIPSFLGGDPIVAEDPTPIPRSIAEHGVRTKMQTKSLQLLRTIRNHGLKDYTETKRAYNLSRHPTPPPPQVCKPAPRSGVGSRLHLGKARRDEVKHTTPNPAPSGMLPTLPRLAASGKAGKPPEDAAGTLFFNQRNERLQNEIPKQMLRRDIFATEAKITIFRCGGHAGFKETGSVPAHEINAALSPGDAPASEAGDGLAEIIVVSPSVPQYNGTYLRVFRPSRPPNAGNPRRSDALAPTPTSFTWVSEDGDRRIIKSEKRWRIERTSYSWLEAANPHNGAHPANCEKWDAWDGDQQKWMYDPTFVIERAGPAKIVVYCPSHREYEGVYTKTDLDMSKLPVWERVDALGRLSPRRRQLERTSLMRLCSHQGHWVIYDAQYTFLESATSARSNIPTSYISWDRWDGPTRRWESAAVSLVMGGGGAMEHGWSDSVDPERQSINGRPQAFMTEIANVDDGTDLRSFIPQVELPSITVEDVLTGRASTLRREGAAAQSKATDELDDTKAETAKMVESLLFGFRSDMKLRDAQRLLGLVYRFSDNETSLAPIPNDFSKFAKAYAQEKSQFQHRCATEIRRMAKQRQSLFKKKKRILYDILRNAPEMKLANPQWRHALQTLQKQMFDDIEGEFKNKRRSLLRFWLDRFKAALPSVQSPSCRAVLVYFDGLFQASDLRLGRDVFFALCNDVLASHHFLLSDVIRVLWCAKRVFQVSDESFCDLVRARTKGLFDFTLQLPTLDSAGGGTDR